MANEPKPVDVPKLIRKLRGIKDKSAPEARAIRRLLRKAGHKGGLRAATVKA